MIAHLKESLDCYRGKRYMVLIWDNASWHNRQKVQNWGDTHNASTLERRSAREGTIFGRSCVIALIGECTISCEQWRPSMRPDDDADRA